MQPVLTVVNGDATYSVYVLEAGQFMPGFGGSKSGLRAGRTASIVLRIERGDGIREDTEYGLRNAEFWTWVARLANTPPGERHAFQGKP